MNVSRYATDNLLKKMFAGTAHGVELERLRAQEGFAVNLKHFDTKFQSVFDRTEMNYL
jgi:hypothetical protein